MSKRQNEVAVCIHGLIVGDTSHRGCAYCNRKTPDEIRKEERERIIEIIWDYQNPNTPHDLNDEIINALIALIKGENK